MTAALMLQGTGSNVGKSMLVAGLCRALTLRDYKVAPFKPQNMSNNAAVTHEGGEIGRAQALQAVACGLPASIHMNPVLLKPQSNVGSQVVVQGTAVGQLMARDYAKAKTELMPKVLESYQRVGQDMDFVLIEGAGSASEVNLRAGDIANMGFAQAANVPVVLVGDIDRGGVIASITGTSGLLPKGDRDRVKGYLINKFRGDASLFQSGIDIISKETNWPSFGIVPWFDAAALLPAEDSEDLKRSYVGEDGADNTLKITVPVLPRIANFDDLDALRATPGVTVEMVEAGRPLPADADLIILPGSKSTIGDLQALIAQGWDIDIKAHARQGKHVLGLCGGYQMLGKTIADPEGMEGPKGSICLGLGLLDIDTVMQGEKRTKLVSGTHLQSGEQVKGYEIHIGTSTGPDRQKPIFELENGLEGAQSTNGLIAGTYLHGLFNEDAFRRAYLSALGAGGSSRFSYAHQVNEVLDQLATHLEKHVDIDGLIACAHRGL